MTTGRMLGLGLAGGVVFSVYTGLVYTLRIGVMCGVCYLVFAIVAVWRTLGAKAFAGLSFDQRQTVLRTLREGQAVADPRLFPAHWQYANAILARPYSPAAIKTVFGLMAAMFGTLVVMDLLTHDFGGMARHLPLAVAQLLTIFVALRQTSRYREQVTRSMQATAQKVDHTAY